MCVYIYIYIYSHKYDISHKEQSMVFFLCFLFQDEKKPQHVVVELETFFLAKLDIKKFSSKNIKKKKKTWIKINNLFHGLNLAQKSCVLCSFRILKLFIFDLDQKFLVTSMYLGL